MKVEHSVRQREIKAETSRGRNENVADHMPIQPNHSSPAHVRCLFCALLLFLNPDGCRVSPAKHCTIFLVCNKSDSCVNHLHAAACPHPLTPMRA